MPPALITGSGFCAGLLWAIAGSLLFGLGVRPAPWGLPLAWLAGELAIGAAVFLALMLGAPSGPPAE